MSDYEIRKVLTDNPLLDEIVYNCKIMMIGTVLKNSDKADNMETLESIRESDLYISAYEKRSRFIDHDFSAEFLKTCSYIPSYKILEYSRDKDKIPQSFRQRIVQDVQNYYVKNYIEQNDYYRTLNGLPPYEINGILVSDLDLSVLPEDFDLGTAKYLHELDNSTIDILNNFGIIDQLKQQNPELKYLDYLGRNKISIYDARKAGKFDILRVPIPSSIEVYNRYIYFLGVNKRYILKRVYTEAYKFLSDYYDEVMEILIVLTTFMDCVSELPEYYIRKDIFDARTIKYLFESNGIPYYEEIPIKYQIRMVKNLNTLIKYKSTNKCIADISSIFGFDNIEIFKYYILRDRNCRSDGTYVYETKFDETTQTLIEDPEKNYELKFLKVPIDKIADDYIRDPINIISYDDMTLNDPLWDGPYNHEEIKRKLIQEEFNIELSKYMSIDTVYELTEMSFDLPYFINMIMFSNIKAEKLLCYIPTISATAPFQLTDLFIYLYALMYRYLGIKDKIFDQRTEILTIMGFNFNLDLPNLINWLNERGETLESLGVQDFTTANGGHIYTFSQLISVFVTNKNVYEIVKNGMKNAQSKEEFEIYRKLFQSFFITKINWDYYNLPKNKEDKENYTYTDFLQIKDTNLYDSLKSIDDITNEEVKKQKISNNINIVVSKIQELLDTDILDTIFSNLPTVSIDYIKKYMYKVIDFFKSYKVRIADINTIYKFDDDLNNRIFIIDEIYELIHTHDYTELVMPEDKAIFNTSLDSKDFTELKERIYMIKEWFAQRGLSDNGACKELITRLDSIFDVFDECVPNDGIYELTAQVIKTEWIPIYEEIISMIVSLIYTEHIYVSEEIYSLIRWFTRLNLDNFVPFDTVVINAYKQLDEYVNYQYKESGILDHERYGMKEMIAEKNYVFDKTLYVNIYDKFYRTRTTKSIDDRYEIGDGYYMTRTYD